MWKNGGGRTGQLNDLAPVEEWGRDSVQSVRSANEQHLTQINGHINIMILQIGGYKYQSPTKPK